MFLTHEEKVLLNKTTKRERDGSVTVKKGLSNRDKERLRLMDEANFMTMGEHLICNFEDLE